MISTEQLLFATLHRCLDQMTFSDIGDEQKRSLNAYLAPPDEQADYPFIVLGDVQEVPRLTKTSSKGRFHIDVHVWGTQAMRFYVSQICAQIITETRHFEVVGHTFRQRQSLTDKMIRMDTSTADKLWHGIVQLSIELI